MVNDIVGLENSYELGPDTIETEFFVIMTWELASVRKIMVDFWEKWRNPPVYKSNRKRAEFG